MFSLQNQSVAAKFEFVYFLSKLRNPLQFTKGVNVRICTYTTV